MQTHSLHKFLLLSAFLLFNLAGRYGCTYIYAQNQKLPPLLYAIKHGDTLTVKKLIASGVNVIDEVEINPLTKITPFEVAIASQQMPMIELLIEAGVWPHLLEGKIVNDENWHYDARVNDKQSAFYLMAISHNNTDAVEYFLSRGFPIKNSLLEACAYNRLDIVKQFVYRGANVNYQEVIGLKLLLYKRVRTPIYWAVKNNNLEMSQFLVNFGVPINEALKQAMEQEKPEITNGLFDKKRNINYSKAIFDAARYGYTGLIAQYLAEGADLYAENDYGETILFVATKFGNLGTCQYLIETKGMSPFDTTRRGETLLMYAADKGSIPLIDYYLDKGLDIEAEDWKGNTPIFFSTMWYREEAFFYLVEKGANIYHKAHDGYTLLMEACDNFNKEDTTIRFLVDKEVFVDAYTKRNKSHALGILICNLQVPCSLVELFLKEGVDVNEINCYDKSLMEYAISNEDYDMVKLLIAYGYDVNQVEDRAVRPLDLAIKEKDESIIELLKKNGALTCDEIIIKKAIEAKDINTIYLNELRSVIKFIEEDKLNTAHKKKIALIATTRGYYKIPEILLNRYKFDINTPINDHGQTMLIIATINEHPELVEYLLENGADMHIKDNNNQSAIDYVKGRKLKKAYKPFLKK